MSMGLGLAPDRGDGARNERTLHFNPLTVGARRTAARHSHLKVQGGRAEDNEDTVFFNSWRRARPRSFNGLQAFARSTTTNGWVIRDLDGI